MYYHQPPPTPLGEDRTVELYGLDFKAMYNVPVGAIAQMPSKKHNVTRLVACSNFTNAVTEGTPDPACSAGLRCRFVHVLRPLSDFPSRTIHVHYIWQSLEAVSYARLWGGPCSQAPAVWLMDTPDCRAEVKRYDDQRQRSSARLLTAGGNVEQHEKDEDERVAFAMMVDLIASVAPAMRVPATRLLKTAGASTYLQRRLTGTKPDFQLTPCSDYMCHNECRMGEECPGAHVINLDVSQSTPFVRRTLRHVKAASEATMVQNEGRVQNGLFGLVSGRSKPRVLEVEGTGVQKQLSGDSGEAQGPGNSSNGISKDISKGNSTEAHSSRKQEGSSDECRVGVANTESSSVSPMQFNASTIATPSTNNSGNESGGGSGDGGSGDGSSNCQRSPMSDGQSDDDESS